MSEKLLEPETGLEMQATSSSAGDLLTNGPQQTIGTPEWFAARQSEAWKKFQQMSSPEKKSPAWRFNSMKVTAIEGYDSAGEIEADDREELITRSTGIEGALGRMVFGNGHLLDRSRISAELEAKGVLFLPLDRAMREHPDLVKKHFMTQAVKLGSERFAALHESQLLSGTFLYVPKETSLSMPLEIFQWLSGSNRSTFPHTLIIAERGSKVTLVEYFESQDELAEGFACGVNDLFVGEGATVRYVSVQNWGKKVRSIQLNSTVVERDGVAKNLGVHLGGFANRSESVSRLMGVGGRSDMLAATAAVGDQEFDQRTLQDHVIGTTSSDLLYKNCLLDRSRCIFSGLIKVEPHAHKTDAYQKVRNLMLSDEAEANSMPGLEILADEVRCTHGATSGFMDPNELFYFLARGISKPEAQRLMILGFLNEAIERLGEETVQSHLSNQIALKLSI